MCGVTLEEQNSSVRQGCILEPVLFNVLFNEILEETCLIGLFHLRYEVRDINLLHNEYADDLYIVDVRH